MNQIVELLNSIGEMSKLGIPTLVLGFLIISVLATMYLKPVWLAIIKYKSDKVKAEQSEE